MDGHAGVSLMFFSAIGVLRDRLWSADGLFVQLGQRFARTGSRLTRSVAGFIVLSPLEEAQAINDHVRVGCTRVHVVLADCCDQGLAIVY